MLTKAIFTGGTMLVFALMVLIQRYFQAREDRPASRVETVLATVWLVIRRVVCFGFAGLFGLLALMLLLRVAAGAIPPSSLAALLLLVPFAVIGIHVGMNGMGDRRYDLDVRNDKPVHLERKKRYHWRW